MKERLMHAVTLVVGAVRPEAETSVEMKETLRFFHRFFPQPIDQFIGGKFGGE